MVGLQKKKTQKLSIFNFLTHSTTENLYKEHDRVLEPKAIEYNGTTVLRLNPFYIVNISIISHKLSICSSFIIMICYQKEFLCTYIHPSYMMHQQCLQSESSSKNVLRC